MPRNMPDTVVKEPYTDLKSWTITIILINVDILSRQACAILPKNNIFRNLLLPIAENTSCIIVFFCSGLRFEGRQKEALKETEFLNVDVGFLCVPVMIELCVWKKWKESSV